jgi:hypothetical protein
LLQHWDTLYEPAQFAVNFVPNDDYIGGDSLQGQLRVPQSLGVSNGGDSRPLSNEICHDCSSTPATHGLQFPSAPIPSEHGYEDFSDCLSDASLHNSWQATSRRGSRSRSRAGSRVGSRSSSIGSLNNGYVRGRVSSTINKTTSVHRTNSSTRFQELVFDANPSRPDSTTSASSGRHKPLDSIARAAIKAVKAISACWRCRFLRKQVD